MQDRDLNKNSTPEILYHATHSRFIEKIKKIGLVPKSQSKNSTHPDRIYLTEDKEIAKNLAQNFANMEYKNDHNYVLLEIDMTKLPNVKLHRDPHIQNCFFVNENIPPLAINFERAINLNLK